MSIPGADLQSGEVTQSIIGAFYRVYNTLGSGFLESVYTGALCRELDVRGHRVARQIGVSVTYDGVEVAFQRLDLLIDDLIVVEVKATERLHPIASRQLYNYLKATGLSVGLLLHFGPEPFVKRVYHRPQGSSTQQRV